MAVDERAKGIIKEGSIQVRVKRTGMYQLITLRVKRVQLGQEKFAELYFQRVIDRTELQRLANELKLPIEAENGRALPEGTSPKDFAGL